MSNSKSFPLPSGDVAAGIVPIDPATGYPLYSRLLRQIRILGKCSDLDNVLRDTWDGPTPLYVFPTAPMQMQIVSTSAGYVFDLEQWQVSSGSTGAHFCQHTLVATSDEGDVHAGVFLPKDEQGTQNNGTVINYPFPFESFPARTDIKVAIISDNPSANVIALTAFFGRLRPIST